MRRAIMPPAALEYVDEKFRSEFIRDFYVHYRDHEIGVEDPTEWQMILSAAISENVAAINAAYADSAHEQSLWSRFDDLWMAVL